MGEGEKDGKTTAGTGVVGLATGIPAHGKHTADRLRDADAVGDPCWGEWRETDGASFDDPAPGGASPPLQRAALRTGAGWVRRTRILPLMVARARCPKRP